MCIISNVFKIILNLSYPDEGSRCAQNCTLSVNQGLLSILKKFIYLFHSFNIVMGCLLCGGHYSIDAGDIVLNKVN